MKKRRVHYVLSTHWDREWHQSFQDFRYHLVRLMDRVLAGHADGRLQGPFQTDGQAILLEDYLEIKPEARTVVEELARDGKLVIGPWYVMPDEFTVSGESLIRNLLLGRAIAREFGGEPSAAGFVCDMFGHISQLPQIFAGFGIKAGYIWRGVNVIDTRNMLWHGADGTVLVCSRFGVTGYGSFAIQVRHIEQFTREFDADTYRREVREYLDREAAVTDIDSILLLDSCDHQEWDEEAYAVLLAMVEQEDWPYEVVHTSLDAYLDDMLAQTERISTKIEGELREPGFHRPEVCQQWLIPGILSSRVWMKQANAECEALLCRWAEPFNSFAGAALGTEYPQGFLDVAWKWLLRNHPHDSIDGCSVDQVHRDMRYRFDQCRLIAARVTDEALSKLAASVEGDLSDGELRVTVFNPLPRDFEQVAEITLRTPADWPQFNEFFGYEPKPAFRIYDADGEELAYQRLEQGMDRRKVRHRPNKFPEVYQTHDVKVALTLKIPATGYTTLSVRAGEVGSPTRHALVPGFATSERAMANEHLSVQIEANGTLTLTDRQTGHVYRDLLTFEDCADIGDGWFHGMAVNDRVFVSSACTSEVALVYNGPMLTTFRVRTTMRVPAEFRFDSMTRSDIFADLVFDSRISLRPGQTWLDIETTVQNNAGDHRVRVLLPTGAAAADTYLADSAFDVVERPIALRGDNHLYRELEVEPKPQQTWTAVHDAERGLAVVSSGLLESAVRDLPERPIALTLFRGTRRTAFTDGQPDGQLRGTMTFAYRILPLHGEPDRAALCELGEDIAAGLRVVQLRPREMKMFRGNRSLPAAAGFLRISGAARTSSLRKVGDALELRLFNPSSDTVAAEIDTTPSPAGVTQPRTMQPVDFEGNASGEAVRFDGKAQVSLAPKQILTLRLAFPEA